MLVAFAVQVVPVLVVSSTATISATFHPTIILVVFVGKDLKKSKTATMSVLCYQGQRAEYLDIILVMVTLPIATI